MKYCKTCKAKGKKVPLWKINFPNAHQWYCPECECYKSASILHFRDGRPDPLKPEYHSPTKWEVEQGNLEWSERQRMLEKVEQGTYQYPTEEGLSVPKPLPKKLKKWLMENFDRLHEDYIKQQERETLKRELKDIEREREDERIEQLRKEERRRKFTPKKYRKQQNS